MFYSQRTVEVNIRPHLNVGRLEAIVVRLEEITFSLNCLEFDPVQVPVVDDLLIPLVEFFDLRLEAIVVRLEAITFSLNCLEFDPVQVPVVDDLLIPLVEFFDLLLELVVFLVVGIEPKLEHEYKNCKDHS